MQVDYSLKAEPHEDVVPVLKLHGSCNFVSQTGDRSRTNGLQSRGLDFSIGWRALAVHRLEHALQFVKQTGEYPIMSQVSFHKETMHADNGFGTIRSQWNKVVSVARCLVIIGVSFNPHDQYVIDAVRNAAQVLYVGGTSDFMKWAMLNKRTVHAGETFAGTLCQILQEL
jgi:hypothetical protein